MSRPHDAGDAASIEPSDGDDWTQELARRAGDRTAGYHRWLRRIEGYRKTGRLFEVGCGGGTLLKAAIAAGWSAEGNEMSVAKANYAQRQTGATVLSGPMEDVDLEPDAYDVILCNNVLEHLFEPRQVLVKLARALRPGGALYLQTLNGQSLSLWFEPTAWIYYGPGHLYVPTLVSLAHYFRVAGLTIVRRETHGFRSAQRARDQQRPGRTASEKWFSMLAGRLNRGHRVEYILQRPGGNSRVAPQPRFPL